MNTIPTTTQEAPYLGGNIFDTEGERRWNETEWLCPSCLADEQDEHLIEYEDDGSFYCHACRETYTKAELPRAYRNLIMEERKIRIEAEDAMVAARERAVELNHALAEVRKVAA